MSAETNSETARAQSLFAEGYSCSQAVLLAFAPRLGLDADTAARIASPFGGGIARCGWTCGALSGAFLAVGLHAGHTAAQDSVRKDDVYARVQAIAERFREAHGSTQCHKLIGFDLLDAGQRQAAADAQVFTRVCPRFVRTAAALAAETLAVPRT
jgi:C_GCAxxG_C_C family probable redox protein